MESAEKGPRATRILRLEMHSPRVKGCGEGAGRPCGCRPRVRGRHRRSAIQGKVEMDLRRKFGRRRTRAVTLGVAVVALLAAAASFAGASGAQGSGVAAVAAGAPGGYPQKEADQAWAYQRFLVSDQADMDRLNQMGVDLGESLDKNADGTMWAYAVVTATQRDYLADLGFRPGSIVQTSADAEKARAEMAATSRSDMRTLRLARSKGMRGKHAFSGETLKITRADYYQSLSGTWLSIEAKSSAAQGNAAVPA